MCQGQTLLQEENLFVYTERSEDCQILLNLFSNLFHLFILSWKTVWYIVHNKYISKLCRI